MSVTKSQKERKKLERQRQGIDDLDTRSKNTCKTHKTQHLSSTTATRHLELMCELYPDRFSMVNMNVYKCKFCAWWHTGHKKGSDKINGH